MANQGYKQSHCRRVGKTSTNAVEATDFILRVTAAANGGNFDIRVEVDNRPDGLGDVASFVNCGNIGLFDDVNDVSATANDAGLNTTGAPAYIAGTFASVASTSGNVDNLWKVVFTSLQVVCKDGTTRTIPTLTKTFPSPL